MSIKILMPALSPTMTEGNLAKWHVKEGDKVNPGDVIAEIETDKATMEVEAVDEGIIGRILVAEGAEAVAVNATIGVLLEDGEDASAISHMGDAPDASGAAETQAAPSAAETADTDDQKPDVVAASAAAATSTSAASTTAAA